MGFFDRIVGNAIGSAVGSAVGGAVGKVTDAAVDGVVQDMKMSQERKQMALDEEKKVLNLPPTCPHCGAATVGELVCRYCDCKIVE